MPSALITFEADSHQVAWPLPAPHELHLWLLALAPSASEFDHLEGMLSREERHRAFSIIAGPKQIEAIVARGYLRALLGGYLGVPPQAIEFQYGSWGKPRVANGVTHHGIEFNLSHSHGLGLYAFAVGTPVGVDLEWRRPDVNVDALAKTVFAREELAHQKSLPRDERVDAFFQAWVRKEAIGKALGTGLAAASSAPRHNRSMKQEPHLRAMDLDIGEQYAAALAVRAVPGVHYHVIWRLR
jgi:4'-phosphopantetheinyl transferase